MDEEILLKEYPLSECIVEKLKVIKEKLKENIARADPTWKIIVGKGEEDLSANCDESNDDNDKENIDASKTPEDRDSFPSTQFYFTQVERNDREDVHALTQNHDDILECLFEGLERTNGKLDFGQLENLSDVELNEVTCDLAKKLSVTGTYNLCCSMCLMNLEQRMRYTAVIFNQLLLPKIIALDRPSRLLSSAVVELVEKFPDDVQKLIFIPLLTVDLKDVTIVNAIANAFQPERKSILLTEFLASVKELGSWHIPILQKFTCVKTDRGTNDKVVRLFSDKALEFEKDKSFGKLVLSFIKTNNHLSEEQKILLQEVADVHQTLFKKPIENILKTHDRRCILNGEESLLGH